MNRSEIHEHIHALADKVKYMNEGIRHSRFVEKAEIDLLENYIDVLHQHISALRQEQLNEYPARETAEVPDQKEPSVKDPVQQDNDVQHARDESETASNIPVEKEEEPASSSRTIPETENHQGASQGSEEKEASPNGEDNGLSGQEKRENQPAKDESTIPEDDAERHSPSIEQEDSTGEPHHNISDSDKVTEREEAPEKENGDNNQPQKQEEEKEEMPAYIKRLLNKKIERGDSWEEVEKEADEHGGQSYVDKIRELKRKAVIQTDRPTLNDRLKKQSPELSEKIKTEVEDIRQAIGMNDRFLFISELFNGNTEAYNQSIEELNRLQTKEEAEEYVQKRLAPMEGWQQNPRIAKKMNDLIVRRFSKS